MPSACAANLEQAEEKLLSTADTGPVRPGQVAFLKKEQADDLQLR